MKNKRPKLEEHSWVCQQSSGVLGEVLISKPLNFFTVQAVLDNPVKAIQACPLGEIICVDCQSSLFPDRENVSTYSRYIARLKDNLLK